MSTMVEVGSALILAGAYVSDWLPRLGLALILLGCLVLIVVLVMFLVDVVGEVFCSSDS